ncbi:MAG: hypothetical protein JWL83_1742 [Actinomycetia bacterium]|nr:hypothetical protein [Actinomycetes bacterium]
MTTLKEQLRADLTDAMRNRADVVVSTLRMALAAITKAEVAGKEHVTLSDDEVLGVLRSEARKRTEAAETYAAAGRDELATRERSEAEVLAGYLPAELDDDALGAIVSEEVARAAADGVTGPKAMGVVVKAVRTRVGTDAAGGRIAEAVKRELAAQS